MPTEVTALADAREERIREAEVRFMEAIFGPIVAHEETKK
jgi:hypothetical protein